MNYKDAMKQLKAGAPVDVVLDAAFDELNTLIKQCKKENADSERAYKNARREAAEYKEQWLNAERGVTVLQHKLKEANEVITQRNAELTRHCACIYVDGVNTEQCRLHGAWCDTLHEQADYRRERDALRAELSALRAGSGEAVARMLTWIGKDTYPRKGYTISRTYEECPKNAYPESWEEGPPLFLHPQPSAVPVVRELVEALEHIQRCIGFGTATLHQGSATWCQSDDAITNGQQWLKECGE